MIPFFHVYATGLDSFVTFDEDDPNFMASYNMVCDAIKECVKKHLSESEYIIALHNESLQYIPIAVAVYIENGIEYKIGGFVKYINNYNIFSNNIAYKLLFKPIDYDLPEWVNKTKNNSQYIL